MQYSQCCRRPAAIAMAPAAVVVTMVCQGDPENNQPLLPAERSMVQNASCIRGNLQIPSVRPSAVVCNMYCTIMMLRRVLKLLLFAILLEISSAVVVAFTTSTKAVWTRHWDAKGRPLCYSASSGIRRQTSNMYRGRSSPTTTTSMSLLRTFEARELQLQRFIGELGFVEITDWYARYSRRRSAAIMC